MKREGGLLNIFVVRQIIACGGLGAKRRKTLDAVSETT